MAAFYEQPKKDTANFTSHSRGQKSDTSWGDALKGFGETLSMGVEAADTYNKGMIKEEVREQTETLNSEYGVDAAVDTQGGIRNEATPREIEEGRKRLQLLKSATAAGTMKESSFWAQAELISRQLKMRYPGYWEHIDNTMSRAVGRKPDTALRQQLQAEREADATKSDKERRSALRAARSAGLTDVFIAEQQGKPLTTEEINRRVAQRNGIAWSQQAQLRQYNLKKQQGQATEEDAKRAARSQMSHIVITKLGDATTALGETSQEAEQLLERTNKLRASGQAVPPELQQQLIGTVAQLRAGIDSELTAIASQHADTVSSSELKTMKDDYMSFLDRYSTAVQTGDTAVAGASTALLKSMQDYAQYSILNKHDVIRRDSAISQALGPQAYSWVMQSLSGTGVAEDQKRAWLKVLTDKSLLEGTSMFKQAEELQDAGITDPKVYDGLTKVGISATTEKILPGSIRERAIEAQYGPDNMDFLIQKVEPRKRHVEFGKRVNPHQTKELKAAFDRGEISSEHWMMYLRWATENAIQSIRDWSSDLNQTNEIQNNLSVAYDPETGQLEITEKPIEVTQADTWVGQGIEWFGLGYGRIAEKESIDRTNTILDRMRSVFEAQGKDPKKEGQKLLNQAGVRLDIPEEVKRVSPTGELVSTVETWAGKHLDQALRSSFYVQAFQNATSHSAEAKQAKQHFEEQGIEATEAFKAFYKEATGEDYDG